jgi:hypothetical protein
LGAAAGDAACTKTVGTIKFVIATAIGNAQLMLEVSGWILRQAVSVTWISLRCASFAGAACG